MERKIKSSEDEKTRERTEPCLDGESSASKVSFFFSPKRGGERRREKARGGGQAGGDGGMRSRGATLSPAAPQDCTPKPKNPTGLPLSL